ncbi:MAG: dephospho-CoA kinase [Deltaproteobacteria bacterium]|nr:dephospho-CoA kinase [Deltaproteobacteria bacterium]
MKPELYRTEPDSGQAASAGGGLARVFTVGGETAPCRLDAFLGGVLRGEGLSREKIKQAIVSGLVSLNGSPCAEADTKVFPGDAITAALAAPSTTLSAEAEPISLLWRDAHLAVLNKPAGLTVHPAPGRESGTLAHRLLHHFPELAAMGGRRPGIVHRLDKDTSGLLLVALTEEARLAMSGAFAERAVKKEYLALLQGVPEQAAGSITAPIGRSPTNKTTMAVVPETRGGKTARSDYTLMHADPGGRFSLARVAIHTGRTHQIRVHLRHIGHPLLGDAVYGRPDAACPGKDRKGRQMLHAWKLAFTHPLTGEDLAFSLPPPDDFLALAADLATPMRRVVVTGSPGGGKSAVTKALGEAGLPVWSADAAVRHLYEKGADGWYLLARRYGSRFVPDDNSGVDKGALFEAMRASDELRREVERLIHPLLEHALLRFWDEQEKRGAAAVAAEVPLALEAGWFSSRNARRGETLVGVYSPFATRRDRLARLRGWPDEMIAAMESWQWPEDKKIRAAGLVVDNSGSLEDLCRRAASLVGVLAVLRRRETRRMREYFASLWR